MKARLIQNCNMWHGEVYLNCWCRVTSFYFTKFGAKQALKRWKRENTIEVFEL